MINDIKHIFNKGVNKSPIFLDDSDKKRFLESLYKLNNKGRALRDRSKDMFQNPPGQKKIVEVLKWTLMPNYFHLLLLEKETGGITEFIKRLTNSYTKYFNIKYKRSGYLFQNKTQTLLIERKEQFLYIPSYIDLSSLSLSYPSWKENGVKNADRAMEWLTDYEWSSFYDYQDVMQRKYNCLINQAEFYKNFSTNKNKYKTDLLKLIKEPLNKLDR